MARSPRRKAEETRQNILITAERLFRERGMVKCSIADIAEALSMSPANVFKHFQSKAILADAVCERHVSQMIDNLEKLDRAAPTPERLACVTRRLMETHLRDLAESPYLYEMVFTMSQTDLPSGQIYRRRLESLFCELISEGVEAGFYYCADPATTGQFVAAAFASVLHPAFIFHADKAMLDRRCGGIATLVNTALQNPLAK